MPDIELGAFTGKEDVLNEEWATLTTAGPGQQAVEEFLESFGWDQKAAGVVNVKLSPDNTKVMAARFTLAGKWQEEATRIQAKKLWPELEENVIMEVTLDNLSLFRFSEGEMWSEFLVGDALPHRFIMTGEDARVMTDEELAEKGVGEFCLRAVFGLAKTCSTRWGIWVSTNIMIYPESEEAMMDLSLAAKDPAWPGIRLSDGDVAVLPAAGRGKAPLAVKAWGCPIAPAIQPGALWSNAVGPLAGGEVVKAVGGLLNTGCLVESSVASESLRKKWEKVQRAPGDLRRKPAEKTWPADTTAAAVPTATAKKGERGKMFFFFTTGGIEQKYDRWGKR